MLSERAVFSHTIKVDPFDGTTSLSIKIEDCPSEYIFVTNVFEVENFSYKNANLKVHPFLVVDKDGRSDGGLVFSAPCFRNDCEISVLFDDNTILSKVLVPIGDLFLWKITEEDSKEFMYKKVRMIRAHSSDRIYDYNFLEQSEFNQGVQQIFQDLCLEFICVAEQELHWSPPSEKKPTSVSDIVEEPLMDDSDACYVYLMLDTTNGYCKIGMSNNPEYRESTLQSEKPTIEKICEKKFPSRRIASAIEASLHKVFQEKRIRGEWFVLDARDIWEVKQTLS